MESILEIMKKRRSVRSHLDKPIDREMIELMIEAANCAPSASNAYPWKVVVVQNRKLLRKIQAVSPGMLGRPAAVLAFCDDRERTGKSLGEFGAGIICLMDAAHAAQNVCLLAAELGIGSCCIMSFNPDAVGELLGIRSAYKVDYLVSLGYQDREPPALKKRSVDEAVISWIEE
jgi:nitroreductase